MGQWRQTPTTAQKSVRVTTHVPVRISTVDAETDPATGERFYRSDEVTTANLSRGGAFVASWEPLAAGRRVTLLLQLDNGLELELAGKVAWTRRQLKPTKDGGIEPAGYGIEFLGGNSFERAALDHHLARIEAQHRPGPATAAERAEGSGRPTNTASPQP